jgi:hypothetical protein
MKISDEKIIEFFWKSPLKSFPAMLDVLRYVDGNWIQGEVEYELFDDALWPNSEGKIQIRVPKIGGITANALLAFAWHAKTFNLIRRRPRALRASESDPPEIIVFYELSPSGRYVVKLLEVLTDATSVAEGRPS